MNIKLLPNDISVDFMFVPPEIYKSNEDIKIIAFNNVGTVIVVVTKSNEIRIFGNSNSSIKALVAAIETINSDTSKYSSVNSSTEQIVIEKAEVNIQPGVISNDYEAKRAGEMALEQMVKIARKTGKQSVRR